MGERRNDEMQKVRNKSSKLQPNEKMVRGLQETSKCRANKSEKDKKIKIKLQ